MAKTHYKATFSNGKVLTRTSPRSYAYAWAAKRWLELPVGEKPNYSGITGFSGTKELALKAIAGKEGAEIALVEVVEAVRADAISCTYPACKCIVSTSTSAPVPTCPRTGEPAEQGRAA